MSTDSDGKRTIGTSLMKVINKFEDAKIEDGGSGAFYIYLKKKI